MRKLQDDAAGRIIKTTVRRVNDGTGGDWWMRCMCVYGWQSFGEEEGRLEGL